MKQRVVALVLLASCAVLGVAAFFISGAKDKKAPKITVSEAKVSYIEGDSHDSLLEGISAKDNRDGDLTDEVFIDRIIPKAGNEKAIVYYAVTDKSHNVGTAKRTVAYYKDAEAAKNAGAEDNAAAKEEQASAEVNASPEAQAPEENKAQAGVYPPDPLDLSAGKPVVQLKQQEVTEAVGTTVNLMDYINTIADTDTSNENHNYMYSHVSITVNGVQNTSQLTLNQAGEYEIAYFSGNMHGAVSDPTVMKIIVQ